MGVAPASAPGFSCLPHEGLLRSAQEIPGWPSVGGVSEPHGGADRPEDGQQEEPPHERLPVADRRLGHDPEAGEEEEGGHRRADE